MHRKNGHVMTEVISVMLRQAKENEDHLQPPEVRRGKERFFSLELSEGT